MNALRSVFSTPKMLLPVVHVQNEDQAFRNVDIATNAEADGVFLINHDVGSHELWRIY